MRVGLRLGIDGSTDAAVATSSSSHGGGIEELFLAFDLHHRVEGLCHDGAQFFHGYGMMEGGGVCVCCKGSGNGK